MNPNIERIQISTTKKILDFINTLEQNHVGNPVDLSHKSHYLAHTSRLLSQLHMLSQLFCF